MNLRSNKKSNLKLLNIFEDLMNKSLINKKDIKIPITNKIIKKYSKKKSTKFKMGKKKNKKKKNDKIKKEKCKQIIQKKSEKKKNKNLIKNTKDRNIYDKLFKSKNQKNKFSKFSIKNVESKKNLNNYINNFSKLNFDNLSSITKNFDDSKDSIEGFNNLNYYNFEISGLNKNFSSKDLGSDSETYEIYSKISSNTFEDPAESYRPIFKSLDFDKEDIKEPDQNYHKKDDENTKAPIFDINNDQTSSKSNSKIFKDLDSIHINNLEQKGLIFDKNISKNDKDNLIEIIKSDYNLPHQLEMLYKKFNKIENNLKLIEIQTKNLPKINISKLKNL